MSIADVIAAPGGPIPGGAPPRPTYPPKPMPALHHTPADVTRVLVVGPRDQHQPGRVPWALTQLWRREGRPLVVVHGPGRGAARWARAWAEQHQVAGVRREYALGQHVDVVLAFGGCGVGRAGVEVIDGDAVGELS